MADEKNKIQEIETYLEESYKHKAPRNVSTPIFEKNESYKEQEKIIDFIHYVYFANYHYFISRILFISGDQGYTYFAAHQCIENYLKGYIKQKNQPPPNHHDLPGLVKKCRELAQEKDTFITNSHIMILAEKFNTSYEIPRYPVTHNKWVPFSMWFPSEIEILDYFVYQMVNLLEIPGELNNLKTGNIIYTHLLHEYSPELIAKFSEDNLVFQVD